MACYTFIESIFAEDAESSCEATFEVVALFVFILEFRGRGDVEPLGFGFLIGKAGFERSVDVGLLIDRAVGWR